MLLTVYRMSMLVMLLLYCHASRAQEPSLDEIRKMLGEQEGHLNNGFVKAQYALENLDSAKLLKNLQLLEPTESDNAYYHTRYGMTRGGLTLIRRELGGKEEGKYWANKALREAYRSGDPQLVFFALFRIGCLMYSYDELELAATYLLKSEEVFDALTEQPYYEVNAKLVLGEVLFHTGDYENCIKRLKKGMATSRYRDTRKVIYVKDLNTLGQAYQKLGQWDSAKHYFQESIIAASALNKEVDKQVWLAINAAFKGQVLYQLGDLDSARILLEYDYAYNRNVEKNVAAYSLNWLARIHLQEGEKAKALAQVREAIYLLSLKETFQVQRLNYLREVYRTAIEVHRSMGTADSIYHYAHLFHQLDDSLKAVAFRSGLGILQTKLENERVYAEVQGLQKARRAAELQRNYIIIFIILAAVIALLFVNRLRQAQKFRERAILQEREAADALAREQLQSVTRTLLEKAAIVETLQHQLDQQEQSTEKGALINALSSYTILTEEDWQGFRTIFEKLYPGFFLHLKETVPDITVAELRMAALTRLQLSTQQIASILGISLNSVYKTKQRLRQRLQLSTDASVEERLLGI